jgi:hypothetical protein
MVMLISPKHAMATPATTGITAIFRFLLVALPKQYPKMIATAGTKLLITWLKLTLTYRRLTLPMAMLRLKMTLKAHVLTVPA